MKKRFDIKNLDDYPLMKESLNNKIKSTSIESSCYKDGSILVESNDNFTSTFVGDIIILNKQNNSFIKIPYSKKNNQLNIIIEKLLKNSFDYTGEWIFYLIAKQDNQYEYFTINLNLDYLDTKLIYEQNEYVVIPVNNSENELSLLINQYIKIGQKVFQLDAQLKNIKVTNKGYELNAIVLDKVNLYQLKLEKIVLRLRNKSNVLENDFVIANYIQNNNLYTINFKMESFLKVTTYWDAYIVAKINGNEVYIRLMVYSPKIEFELSSRISHFENVLSNNYILYPYVTLKKALSFTYRKKEVYENKKEKRKEILAFTLALILKPIMNSKKIWILYGKDANEAQDNSFYFFEYLINHTNKKNVYYVIKKGSLDIQNTNKFNQNIIYFASFKYYFYLFSARLLVASEFRMHVYSIAIQKGLLKTAILKTPFVFLQHGIIGFKKVDFFSKKRENHADLFITSSSMEKDIVVKKLFYNKNDVIVTGLARWDVIEARKENNTSEKRNMNEILLMPTWRSWLLDASEEEFIRTDFYKNYIKLITSEKLAIFLDKSGVTINFLIHPKFKKFSHLFDTKKNNINSIYYGQEAINEVLARCDLLITDYSSIAWEALYRSKPTLFYQFDKEEYQKKEGSYINLNEIQFGYKAETLEELLVSLHEIEALNYRLTDKDKAFRKQFFDHIDRNNSERIFNEIIDRETKLTPALLSKRYLKKQIRYLQRQLQNVNWIRVLLKKEKIWK